MTRKSKVFFLRRRRRCEEEEEEEEEAAGDACVHGSPPPSKTTREKRKLLRSLTIYNSEQPSFLISKRDYLAFAAIEGTKDRISPESSSIIARSPRRFRHLFFAKKDVKCHGTSGKAEVVVEAFLEQGLLHFFDTPPSLVTNAGMKRDTDTDLPTPPSLPYVMGGGEFLSPPATHKLQVGERSVWLGQVARIPPLEHLVRFARLNLCHRVTRLSPQAMALCAICRNKMRELTCVCQSGDLPGWLRCGLRLQLLALNRRQSGGGGRNRVGVPRKMHPPTSVWYIQSRH